jgi:DNA primase
MIGVAELKERVNILDVAGRYTDLKRRGKEYVGLCPFHQEKTPSFTIDPDNGIYHCFGCAAGGSVVDFIMAAEGLTLKDAMQKLEQIAGGKTTPKPPKPKKAETPPPDYEQYIRTCRARYKDSLGAKYMRERGFPDGVADWCGVGYDPEFVYYRKSDGTKQTGKFVIFPTDNGAFTARNIDIDAPKDDLKRNAAGYSVGLFPAFWWWGVYNGGKTDADPFFIVEGAADAISFIASGYGAVSIGGAGNIRTLLEDIAYLKKQQRITAPFIIYMDADEAGRKASAELSAGLTKLGIIPEVKEWASAEGGAK